MERRNSGIISILLLTFCVGIFFAQYAEGKPPKNTTTYYGYCELDSAYSFQSDDGSYFDKNIGGSDEVEITYDGGSLSKIWICLGSIKYNSGRRAILNFDIYGSATTQEGAGKPVFEILNNSCPSLVHFVLGYWASLSVADYVAFMVDGITQTSLGDINENYRTSDEGHIIYYLLYGNGYPNPPSLVPNGTGPWVFEPSANTVTLYVMRKKGKGNTYERLDLATYEDNMPTLKMTVELNGRQQAPPYRHDNISILWGDIKSP